MFLTRALHGRGTGRVVAIQTLALLPPVAVTIWQTGEPAIGVLVVALIVVLVWDYVFAALRGHPFTPEGITTAAIVTVFVSPDIPLWHLIVVLSLGSVVGERVFGGRGYGFLSPATAALALALLSLPGLVFPAQSPAVALACLPGAVLLLVTGLLSPFIVLGFLAAVMLAFGVATTPEATALFVAGAAALVFLVGEPTAAAVTPSGRIVHGVLAGGLTWIFGGSSPSPPTTEALVFAALMASILAPLIDHLVVSGNAWQRQRRRG